MQEVGSNVNYLHYDMICSNKIRDMCDICYLCVRKSAMLVCFAVCSRVPGRSRRSYPMGYYPGV
jgi:hypothetical protein